MKQHCPIHPHILFVQPRPIHVVFGRFGEVVAVAAATLTLHTMVLEKTENTATMSILATDNCAAMKAITHTKMVFQKAVFVI